MLLFKRCKVICRTVLQRAREKKNHTHISISADIMNTKLEGNNYISQEVLLKNCEVGRMTYIAGFSSFKSTKFGRFCSIGPNCKVIRGEHPTRDFVSTSPAFYDKNHCSVKSYISKDKFPDFRYTSDEKKWSLEVGNDVWIASDAMILEGITISDGAVVGAGAVVTQNVPPYAVVGGVPARVIRYRFDPDQIEWLLKLKWWNKEEEWIKAHAELFEDINIFIQAVDSEES